MAANTYKNNGDYNLERVELTVGKDEKKTTLDLSQVYQDITIYESIYSPFMSGAITIIDNLNLLDYMTLGNGETLNLEWQTAGSDRTIKMECVTYGATTPIRNNEHSMIYTINFATTPFIFAKRQRHWHAFKEKKLCGMVKETFASLLALFETSIPKKELVVAPAENTRHFVFAGQNTMEVFKMCSRYAKSMEDESGYVFYENNQEFQFTPVEKLFKNEPVMKYNLKERGSYTGNKQTTSHDPVKSGHEEAFNAYQDFSFEKPNTYLDRIMSGGLGEVYHFISIRDRFDKIVVSSDNNNPEKALTTNTTMADYATINGDGVVRVVPQLELYEDEDNVVRNNTTLRRLDNVMINIAVFGNSNIKVGDIIEATIPRWNTDMGEVESFDKYSGKYLIAEIKHVLNRTSYNARMKIVRDGFNDISKGIVDETPPQIDNPSSVEGKKEELDNVDDTKPETQAAED